MNITISRIEEQDIESLTRIILKYKTEDGKVVSEKQEKDVITHLQILVDECNPLALVAREGDRILGYINGHIIPFPLIMGRECYVSCLVINSEFRGKGAGGLLVEAIKAEAKKQGCSRLMLNNPKEGESYKREFYKKNGFSERPNFANFVMNL